MSAEPKGVLVVDLGTQYTQLIARRVREAGTWCRITTPAQALEQAAGMNLGGVILSGGPASVYDDDAPAVPKGLLELGVPVLGICYGLHWMCQTLGGEVTAVDRREYGRTSIRIIVSEGLFADIGGHTVVWMSHGDSVQRIPDGFQAYAQSEDCTYAAVGDPGRNLWGVQFHPEVSHTVRGRELIDNFLAEICELPGDWKPDSIVEREIARVRAQVGATGEVIMGLSGGVDSSVAATILHQAIGERLHCIFVDNGLLRKGERDAVEEEFAEHLGMDLTVVDASDRFLGALKGVTDPEQKRKIIGREFIEVFRAEAKRFGDAKFLGQGTLYPDVIESVAAHGGNTAVIKSHHNVGGLPEDLALALVEPLREPFKAEVRVIGRFLGLDRRLDARPPFPGPGPAVRIVESTDAMTADWGHLSHELLQRISTRIINQVRGINRVVLDISSKPPATIEWE